MLDWASLMDGWTNLSSGLQRLVEDINGLGDAGIATAVALLVAWWHSRDQSKNRYSEEKLLAYEDCISRLEVLGEVELLCAEYAAFYQKRESGEDLDASDIEAEKLLDRRCEAVLRNCEKYAEEDAAPRYRLLTAGAKEEAIRVEKLIDKMKAHVDAGNYEKVRGLRLQYEFAHADLMARIREDLGIRN